MSLLCRAADMGPRIELGEEIGYIIIVVGLAAALAFLFQLVLPGDYPHGRWQAAENLTQLSKETRLGVLLAFKGDQNLIEQDADIAELRIPRQSCVKCPSSSGSRRSCGCPSLPVRCWA
jgi:hypothetical protein